MIIAGLGAGGYGLFNSTSPSFAPRVTITGKADKCFAIHRSRKDGSDYSFGIETDGRGSIPIHTKIIGPMCWSSSHRFDDRIYRIVYLDDVHRYLANEAISIEVLAGPDAGWHEALDARPMGIWLAIPLGFVFVTFGYMGIYKIKFNLEESNTPDDSNEPPGEYRSNLTSLDLR